MLLHRFTFHFPYCSAAKNDQNGIVVWNIVHMHVPLDIGWALGSRKCMLSVKWSHIDPTIRHKAIKFD